MAQALLIGFRNSPEGNVKCLKTLGYAIGVMGRDEGVKEAVKGWYGDMCGVILEELQKQGNTVQ